MVIDTSEVAHVRKIVDAVWRATRPDSSWASTWTPEYSVMIETPRAIELAGELAKVVGRFSLGTNDLTQMVFGFDRDDIGGPVMSRYFEEETLVSNPFTVLDRAVKAMVQRAVDGIRATNDAARITVSGEHASDSESARFFEGLGVDYLSCSPTAFRSLGSFWPRTR